ncbi:MAG TPA: CRTAC1 family protein [Chthonomonadaceae bacterium]|nr:CRTAC1 family protein [Chthonomonadaceae bacterium]
MNRTLLLFAGLLLLVTGCGPHPSAPPASAAGGAGSPPLQFEDVTAKAGIHWQRTNGAFGKKYMPETMGGGGAFIDYDNDGYADILLVNGDWWPGHPLSGKRPTLALYHNNRDGTFTEVTHKMGLDIWLQGMGVAVGDYDNDGFDDLYLTGVGGNRLLHNEQGKRFVDVTDQAGVRDSGWSTSAAWVDVDNDGKLDLFVCHYVKWTPQTDRYCGMDKKEYCRPDHYESDYSRLYHNDGHGHFTDITRQAGLLRPNMKGLGICYLDIEGRGFPDLIVANDMEPTCLFRNQGGARFKETALADGLAVSDTGQPRSGMGIDAADYRENGTQGLAIGNFAFEGMALHDLSGPPPYQERARQAGLYVPSYPYVTFGLFFADFDNDGWPDLFATNGNVVDTLSRIVPSQTYAQPCLLFQNRGDGTFADVSQTAGSPITDPIVGRGACQADFNNDGKIDILLIPNTGSARLLENGTPTQAHWLTLKLVGTQSNRDGYGATVTVEAGGRKLSGYCHSGSSYLSASDARLHFGLGSAKTIERLHIHWPDGHVDSYSSLPIDQILQIKEGAPGPVTGP